MGSKHSATSELVDSKYSFTDLVDIDYLRSVLEKFSQCIGLTTGLVSYPGQEQLIFTGGRELCIKYHREHGEAQVHCRESDVELTRKLRRREELNIRPCALGLVHGATPVIIKDAHVASLITGQVFLEEPDIDSFRAQARRYGFDESDYLAALADVPIVPAPKLKEALAFLSEVAVMIGELGLTNLTSRLAAEELHDEIIRRVEVEAERARLTRIVEATTDMVSSATVGGRITYMNRAGRRLVDWPEEGELNKEIRDAHPRSSADLIANVGLPIAVREGVWEGETELRNGSGEIIPVSQVVMSHKDVTGEIEYVSTVIRDMSEQKRVEEELRQARSYIANIVDSMPSVLVGVDEQGQVTRWNREAERMAGLANAAALGRPMAEVFPQLSGVAEMIGNALKTGEPQLDSKVPRQVDGETRYEDVAVYPLLAAGGPGAVVRIDDVTERVKLDEMMVQSEKMLSVGGLAAGMAHEINNPLAGIMQNAALALSRLTAELPANERAAAEAGTNMEAIRAYMQLRGIVPALTAMQQSGIRAATIVDNMLSFSRKGESDHAAWDVRHLLDKTVELAESDYDLSRQYDFRAIRIVREYAAELPETTCEASKIQQVFLNVLKNGAQAMFDGEEPVAEPIFVLRVTPEAGMVRIEIENNGPGLADQVRRRVFEPFFTTKPVGVGTGLGLSVSYFIVAEEHAGTMAVESSEQGGANFIIRLPADQPTS